MVEVVKEDEPGPALERCCSCRARTKYWYEPKDVALCRACALGIDAEDIPTKEEWFARPQQALVGFARVMGGDPDDVILQQLNRALNAGWRFAGSQGLYNLVAPDRDSRNKAAHWKTIEFHMPHWLPEWLEERGLTQGLPPTKDLLP